MYIHIFIYDVFIDMLFLIICIIFLYLMVLMILLRKRLIALISKSINGEQNIYKRIVDQLDEVQHLHQKLEKKTETGVYEDPKISKMTTENIKNRILKSIKFLVTIFEKRFIDYGQIMDSKTCVFKHINEIELQTNSDLQIIMHHVQNVLNKCVSIENGINIIILNHTYGRCSDKTSTKECCKNNIKNTEQQLKYRIQYYTNIINELKIDIVLTTKENQTTFTEFSQITSKAMNLQMKYDCIKIVNETCSNMYNNVCNYEKICLRTDNDLNLKIKDCKLYLTTTKRKRKLSIAKWNVFKLKFEKISCSISVNINKYIETNKFLDEIALQKTDKLQNLNNNIQSVNQLKKQVQKHMTSSKQTLENLNCTLSTLKKTINTYRIRTNAHNVYERKQLTSIKNMDKIIDELIKTKTVEFNNVNNEDCINNYIIYDFDSVSIKELKSCVLKFEENTKKISDSKVKIYELRNLGDLQIETLKREKIERNIKEMNQIEENRQLLLDLVIKDINIVKVSITNFKDLLMEAIKINNKSENCKKVLLNCLRKIMIDNHGKTLEKLTQEEGELSISNLYYADQLRNVRTDSELQMEALLEERIQLLQERMKTITAQREQIEQANRGLEEELDRLSKNVVKMTNNIKVTNEEEEKTN